MAYVTSERRPKFPQREVEQQDCQPEKPLQKPLQLWCLINYTGLHSEVQAAALPPALNLCLKKGLPLHFQHLPDSVIRCDFTVHGQVRGSDSCLGDC